MTGNQILDGAVIAQVPDIDFNQMIESTIGGIIEAFGSVLPDVAQALVLLVVGYMVAAFLGGRTYRVANRLRVDERLAGTPLDTFSGDQRDAIAYLCGRMMRYAVWIIAILMAISAINLQVVRNINSTLINYLPRVLATVLVLLVGFVISRALGRAAATVLRGRGVGDQFESTMLGGVAAAASEDSRESVDAATLGGMVVEYYGYLVTLSIAAGVINLPELTALFRAATFYAPVFVFGLVVIAVGVGVASAIAARVEQSATASMLPVDGVLGELTMAVVVVATTVVALDVIGVSTGILQALLLVLGLPVGLALAIGLGIAFGRGGQDYVAENIGDWF